MKVAFLSDIHLEENTSYPVLEELAALLSEHQAETLILAGDISSGIYETKQAVRQLKERSGIPVFYVPGNHDMWEDKKSEKDIENRRMQETPTSAWERFRQYQTDPDCLINGWKQLGKHYAAVGEIGWYDYSFASPRFSKAELDQMQYSGRVWQDSIRNDWTKDNLGRCEASLQFLEQQMREVQSLGFRILVVTHMLPIREFTVQDGREIWEYFNAFLGTEKLEELYRRFPVDYAICGHVHYRKTLRKNRITYLCPCLNYEREWLSCPETENAVRVRKELQESLQFLEL